ncbi:hypothetical protein RIF29_28884 [Crotalaria pallida]|uniref:Uncharacterized protein n=1 Tax=Crotalaria pallida TaxID=3830 RepID=A0AAN9HVR1_CROPI
MTGSGSPTRNKDRGDKDCSDEDCCHVDCSDSKGSKKKGHGKTILKKLILLRNKLGGKKILVDWNVKGQPTGKYRAMFRSHIGLIVRLEVPITIKNWKTEADNTLRNDIWMEVLTTWDIDEKHRSYVLKAAGDSLKTFRVRLNRWRKKTGANHPPKQYADAITLEEWEEFVHHCTTENCVLKEMASNEASLPRYALYRAARLNKKGEVDNENARQIVEEITFYEQNGGVEENGRDDILAKVLKKPDHPASSENFDMTETYGSYLRRKTDLFVIPIAYQLPCIL